MLRHTKQAVAAQALTEGLGSRFTVTETTSAQHAAHDMIDRCKVQQQLQYVRFHSGWSLQSLPLIFKLPTPSPSHWKMSLFSPPSARVTPKGNRASRGLPPLAEHWQCAL